MHGLVDDLSRFIMNQSARKGTTEVQANLLTETCHNADHQNPCEQVDDKGEVSTNSVAQNPYELPLNSELTVFKEKLDESAINVIGYQLRFNHSR